MMSRLSCLALLWAISDLSALETIKEVLDGSIFRKPGFISVDQYYLELSDAKTEIEIDLLSMETNDNKTFSDVNGDCDSAFIDTQIYLFIKKISTAGNGTWSLVVSNDDEIDVITNKGKGRKDGSISVQDSYISRIVGAGSYMLAVGRFPLSESEAVAGISTGNALAFTPYACQTKRFLYGNYRLTIVTKSASGKKFMQQGLSTYVGNSCQADSWADSDCMFPLESQSFSQAIKNSCPYDVTLDK